MVMQTKTAGPGQFAAFDLASVPSPCFVTDLARLEDNLAVLKEVADQSGAQILTALKAFSLWSAAPLVSRYLSGACASGLYEARLARSHYVKGPEDGLVSCFAPAYKPQDMAELADICDHIIFNSPQQIARFAGQATAQGAELGLRVNPCLPQGKLKNMILPHHGRVLARQLVSLQIIILIRYPACISTVYVNRAFLN